MHAKTLPRNAAAVQKAAMGRQHWEQGLLLAKRGEWRQAAQCFSKACDGSPKDTLYRLNLARALLRSAQVDQALKHAEQVIQQEPSNLLGYQMMGECHVFLGQHGEAARCMSEGLRLCSPSAEYLQTLGNIMFAAQRYQDGVRVLMDALSMEVDHALSHYRLGLCFNALGMKAEAVECLKTALMLGVGDGKLACHSLMAFIRREQCDWAEAQADLDAMNACLDALTPQSLNWSSVFASVTLTPDVDRHLKAARAASNFYGHGVQALPARPWVRGDKIRIGMVSADFHHHATCILMAELIEQMDRSQFTIHLYSHGPDDGSAMRQRVSRAADRFVDVQALGDRQVAQMIQDDGIDVLIDLKGHTVNCRLGIFAYRAAPIQVSYLGFPGTTGAAYIDYFIGDAHVSPLSEAAAYSEKLALMPVCYQPNDRQRPLPAPTTRAEHGLPDDAVVLCGFNQPFKISPEMMDQWCALLRERPQTVLWLLHWNDSSPQHLREAVQARGIDPARLIFAPKLPGAAHISRFALADVFVDIWPCNGHTTVSDALWAGVPVVTMAQHSFASRVATSLLHAVGLPEGAVVDPSGYQARVLQLIDDAALRQAWRARLVAARDHAPLFDTQRYAADFGHLITRMVDRLASGLPPEHLAAEPGESHH